MPTKDFSYTSGERQTATHIEGIRHDHSSRYELAAAILQQHFGARPNLVGLDAFCGNGYGSCLAATKLGAQMLGIDGSAEAIAVANEYYSSERTLFAAKRFPFTLPHATFDFVLCFESIEHVADAKRFFGVLAASLRSGGVMFVSTPNEEIMPYLVNRQRFKHHVRHFRRDELAAMASQVSDLKLVGEFGQRVYKVDDAGFVSGLDESLDQVPEPSRDDAHFFIQLFVKP